MRTHPVALVPGILLMSVLDAQAGERDYLLTPVPFHAVRIDDAFWSPRLETNRKTTIPFAFEQCEKTGRISNFDKAAGKLDGEYAGYFFNDSDVYKVIEGASHSLRLHPDPQLESYLDRLIEKIAAAQEKDGYLNAYYTVAEPDRKWTDLRNRHELYCAGHLFEAAVAHHQATGKRALLEVAIRFADHIDALFGPGRRRGVPGHPEIEIGLVKLYRLTGEKRYLDLARFFLEQRGRANGGESYGDYSQDHKPVVEQNEAVGHAVRAAYLYSGMADVAALTGQGGYLEALDALWENVVSKKLYITGGIGASRQSEAFGNAYDLPNKSAYAETCAAIANALWNHRMLLSRADARYADVLERVLYNGFLAGVSLSGDRFFYPNPLAADGVTGFNYGDTQRVAWFKCACCPVNVTRFVPSIGGFVYARRERAIYVNLFVAGEATIPLKDNSVRIRQETGYPWSGHIKMTVHPRTAGEFELNIRIPGWANGVPLPGGLYSYLDDHLERAALTVNGEPFAANPHNGYARIKRVWQGGDVIELDLPMPVRRVIAHSKLKANAGRVALVRGPLVYCVEAVDHDGRVHDLVLPDEARLITESRPDLLGGITVIRAAGSAARRTTKETPGGAATEPADLVAIPYYAWNHRGAGEMTVWLPRVRPERDGPPRTRGRE